MARLATVHNLSSLWHGVHRQEIGTTPPEYFSGQWTMPENEFFVFDTNLGVKVRFLPGAHKHGVQAEAQLHVLDAARVVFIRDATRGRSRREWLFLGEGPSGEVLEVIAIPGTREHFLVIHAMPMRKKWQPLWNWMQQGGSS